MKLRRIVWWTIAIPMAITYIALSWLRVIPAAWLATMATLDQALERYEYWTFDVAKDSFVNNPYRWSLWTTWKTAFDEAGSVDGDPRFPW